MPELKIPLEKPVKTHGGEITEVTFREPSGTDAFDLEPPMRTFVKPDGSQLEVRMDGKALKAWLTRLSGLSPADLGALPARHVRQAYQWLQAELNPDEPELPSGNS